MIQVAKAPNGTFSYVARDPKGQIVILGDDCESVDVVRDFFSDLIACATDKKPSRLDVHIEMVELIEGADTPRKMPIAGIGGLADMLNATASVETEFSPKESQTVARTVKSNTASTNTKTPKGKKKS